MNPVIIVRVHKTASDKVLAVVRADQVIAFAITVAAMSTRFGATRFS